MEVNQLKSSTLMPYYDSLYIIFERDTLSKALVYISNIG